MKAFRFRSITNYFSGIYYVYGYFDPRDDDLFYVGKGKSLRYKSHLLAVKRNCSYAKKRNHLKFNKIRKILELGLEPKINLLASNLSESDSLDTEQFIIHSLGTVFSQTGSLTNIVTNKWSRDYSNKDPFKKISDKQKESWRNPLSGHNSEKTKKLRSLNATGKNNPRYGDHRNYIDLYGSLKSLELKHQQSICRTGCNNPRAKEWILISPDNKIFEVSGTLKTFCKENDLSMGVLKKNLNSKTEKFGITFANTKIRTIGWSLYEANVFHGL